MTSSSPLRTIVQPLTLPRRRTWQSVDGLTRTGSYTQGALALSYPLATGVEADPRPTGLVVVPHGARPATAGGTESWAASFVQAVVEVIASDRPITQLIRWTTRRVYADIARRQQLVSRHRGSSGTRSTRHQVATVRVCQPTPESVEIAARVTFSGRSRAVAARLDLVHGRWLCTAIQFG